MIHIVSGDFKIARGEMNLKNVLCDNFKHIDLNDSYFHDEGCVLFGANRRRRYGPIKFSEVGNEVVHLKSLNPTGIFFDGIAEVYDDLVRRSYFCFKERRLIVLKNVNKHQGNFNIKFDDSVDFYVMAQQRSETGITCAKIHWKGSGSNHTTIILPHCGSEIFGFILGLPVNAGYYEDTCLLYLGSKMILELPLNIRIRGVYGSHIDNSACIVCDEAVHFFRFNVSGYDVDVQKHIVFEHEYSCDVYLNPRPLAETPDHQLFLIQKHDQEFESEHLNCLDWSTGSFLEPVLLYQYYIYDETEEGNFFRDFLGDSYIHVCNGVVKASVDNGVLTTRFFTNNNLPYSHDMKQNNDPNLPNNIVQDILYEEETKSMVVKTFNIEEDPESMNPTVETFHLPSFLAEASIDEYSMFIQT
ncbi:hypothetical protein PCE1_004354 [Barthelona sp. PCE]